MNYLNDRYKMLGRFCLCIFIAAGISACGGGNTPLDADTRAIIDSTATAQIARARIELDSVCAVSRQTQMAQMVDSIKKVRLQEIEQQLKFVPK